MLIAYHIPGGASTEADVCSSSGYSQRCCSEDDRLFGDIIFGDCTHAEDNSLPIEDDCRVCNVCAGHGCGDAICGVLYY